MQKNNQKNLKKKDISKIVNLKSGIPTSYANKLLDGMLNILIYGLKKDGVLKIDKFGSFKVLSKNRRIGRNPKNNQIFEISRRKTVSFKASIFLKNKINNE
tara:strand:- start:61 stop:363 length:303 start_codon:yes stop_codon:yes gene_type:complete